MLETITVITLLTLFMIFIRPGKTPPLDNPLTIERPGQYHMVLAPQLNLAQPFIEAIAKQLGTERDSQRSNATLYLRVYDTQVDAHGTAFYLLAITQRAGMLYFQAARPSPDTADQQLVSEFAHAALAHLPAAATHDPALNNEILAAVQAAAQVRNIRIEAV